MNRPKLIDRICQECGASFQARESDVRRGFGKTCSRTCAGMCHKPRKTQAQASHPSTVASHPQSSNVAKNNQEQ